MGIVRRLTSRPQISFILFVTCALVGVHYGTGRHHADLSDENISSALKVSSGTTVTAQQL